MAKRSKRKPAAVAASAVPASAEDLLRRPLYFWLGVAAIVLAVFWVYSPAIHGDWLWDDDWYITNQPLMRDPNGLWKLWFAPGSWVDYYPVSETLLWIEWHLFGNDTLGYHVVNTTLHAMNALLVWRLLARLGLRKAWLGGFLFAVHPVAVDSVAWIAETKNTVSLLFGLLALIAWIDFDSSRRRHDYIRALLFFVLAMMGKISLMMLPAVLLLYTWLKRRRVSTADLTPVALFILVAILLSLTSTLSDTWYWQSIGGPHEALPHLEAAARLALAGQLLAVYGAHVVWPVGLMPVYPQWPPHPEALIAWAPWLAPIAVLALLWRGRDRWGRHAALGVFFFTLFLVPFLGLVVAPYMSFTWLMDHILYAPIIGLIGLFVAALDSIDDRVPAEWRIAVIGAATLIAVLLAFEARAYAGAFTDEATLWGYTADHNPGDWLVQDNLGKAQLLNNQPDDAVKSFSIALLLRPGRAQTHLNLGRAFVALNRLNDGLVQYDAALAIDPTDAEIYNQKGVAFIQSNRAAEAIAPLQRAIELRPHYAIGLENLGIALAVTGHLEEAVEKFNASLAANPNDPATHVNLGRALHQLNRNAEANDQFRQALQLDPNNAAAKAALGRL